jgi:type II secretory pathway component PulL
MVKVWAVFSFLILIIILLFLSQEIENASLAKLAERTKTLVQKSYKLAKQTIPRKSKARNMLAQFLLPQLRNA